MMDSPPPELSSSLWAYLVLFIAIVAVANALFPILLKIIQSQQEKRVGKLGQTLDELFIFLSPQRFLFLFTAVPLLLAGLTFLVTKNLWFSLGATVVGFLFPLFLIPVLRERRIAKFVHQLPDGLMILSSCLKGGLSLIQAVEILCGEMAPPISQEFGLLVREVKMGVSMEEAFKRLKERIPAEDVDLIATAMLVARETGGNLVKIFGHLTTTVRDRIRLAETLKTTTLMARVQGYIMSAIPIIFALFVRRIDPNHFDIMFQTREGQFLAVVAGILWIVGLFLIRKFSAIKF